MQIQKRKTIVRGQHSDWPYRFERNDAVLSLACWGFEFVSDFGSRISDLARWGCFSLLFVLFSGCAVGPNYQRPVINSPGEFRGENEATNSTFSELAWWQVYEDTSLQALIR